MESVNRSLRGVPVLVNAGLLCKPVRHVAKYQSSEISHADQLRDLRVRGFDTSATSGTALFYFAVYLLSLEHRKTARMADLSGIAHDVSGQSRAILNFRQQRILLEGSTLHPAHLLVMPDAEKKNVYNKGRFSLITR